jgi:chromosome segregation ATPase
VFQNELQEKVQEATNQQTKDSTEYGAKLQKYGNEIQSYQADVNKEVQDFVNTLQKEMQEYQSKLALYNADLQKYQAQIGEKTQKVTSATQNASYYSNESKKYYEWAVAEVNMYVQNNSKMINRTIAAQAAQR